MFLQILMAEVKLKLQQRNFLKKMNKNVFFQKIYNLYGPVTRARKCFLYTKKGVRITDCFQENGRAILGWQGDNAFTHFKNVISRGQMGNFICEDKSRLEKSVCCLLNSNRKIMFFAHKTESLKAGLSISQNNTAVYSPWAQNEPDWKNVDVVLIAPPFPWTDSVYILAVKAELLPENHKLTDFFNNNIDLPFSLQAGITRSIYNLIDQLSKRTEKDWFIYDSVLTKYWERKGPYLFSKIPQEKYDDFVMHCLKLGIVINPSFKEKSIVPFGADKGVFTILKNSPFNF